MLTQAIYIKVFFNSLYFETDDKLTVKYCFFKYGYLVLRIFMVIISFWIKGRSANGFVRDCINCFALLILVTKHYQDFPYKSRYI